jgi:hypothetical protein
VYLEKSIEVRILGQFLGIWQKFLAKISKFCGKCAENG